MQKLNQKTNIYFGPPLAKLTKLEKNTLEISSRINRTAERYMAVLEQHGLDLNEAECRCLKEISMIGFMSPDEILHIADDVAQFSGTIEGLDLPTLVTKLRLASFADLVASIEKVGC